MEVSSQEELEEAKRIYDQDVAHLEDQCISKVRRLRAAYDSALHNVRFAARFLLELQKDSRNGFSGLQTICRCRPICSMPTSQVH